MSVVSFDQNTLNAITPIVNTHYSCLISNGKVIVASKSWWDLAPAESFLICLLCVTSTPATCRDLPIYLPRKNPHVSPFVACDKKTFILTLRCPINRPHCGC
jgi:hypothetical protein